VVKAQECISGLRWAPRALLQLSNDDWHA